MARQPTLIKVFAILLVVSNCFGDEIVLKNNNSYSGELVKFLDGKRILFKALPSANLIIDITEVQNLTLSDGTIVLDNGRILINDFENIDEFYFGKVFMTGACCIVILFGGYLVINNFDFLGDYDACFDPNCD